MLIYCLQYDEEEEIKKAAEEKKKKIANYELMQSLKAQGMLHTQSVLWSL